MRNGGDGILGLVGAVHSAVSAVLKLPPTRSTHARRQTVGREREGEEGKRQRETGQDRERETGDRAALRRRLRYLSQTHTHTHGSRVPPATPPVALLTYCNFFMAPYRLPPATPPVAVLIGRHRGRSRDDASLRSYLTDGAKQRGSPDASATPTLDAPLQLT